MGCVIGRCYYVLMVAVCTSNVCIDVIVSDTMVALGIV